MTRLDDDLQVDWCSRTPAVSDAELLARFLSTRDRSIRDELVERYEPLARIVARQMRRRFEPLDELQHIAMVGIWKAIERFDPTFGVAFKTYASATAIGEVRRHYRDHSWAVRVPRRLKDLHISVMGAINELTSQLGRTPTAAEVAQRIGAAVDVVLEAIDVGDVLRPLSSSSTADDISTTSARLVAGRVSDDIEALEELLCLQHLLRQLPAREQQIVALRYFRDLTQTEIAEHMGISQVQVSRLLRRSLARLRYLSDVPEAHRDVRSVSASAAASSGAASIA